MSGQRDSMRILWRSLTLLTVLVIVLHALIPIRMSFDPQAGSAFSAFTSDVSLSRGQMAAVETAAVPATPLPTVEPAPVNLWLAGAGETWLRLADWPPAIGPPAADSTFLPLNPRAPPLA